MTFHDTFRNCTPADTAGPRVPQCVLASRHGAGYGQGAVVVHVCFIADNPRCRDQTLRRRTRFARTRMGKERQRRAIFESLSPGGGRPRGRGGEESVNDVVASLRIGHELRNRHLALRYVVNGPGTPKSLHLPIAALDSCRIVYHIQSMEIAMRRPQRHILIDFPQQGVFHDRPSPKPCPYVVGKSTMT